MQRIVLCVHLLYALNNIEAHTQIVSRWVCRLFICLYFYLQGGMFVTVFDSTSGSYYSYSLQREIKDSTHDEAMDEDMSGSKCHS